MRRNKNEPAFDLEKLEAMSPDEVAEFFDELAEFQEGLCGLQRALSARLLLERARRPQATLLPEPRPSERLLTTEEVAKLLRTTRKWVYRNQKKLGVVKLSRKVLRYHEKSVRKFLDAAG